MVFTIDNRIYHVRISKKLMWWRSGPKGTIYTRPDESPFFCPPTKIWLRVVTTTWFGVYSIFRSSTFIGNDSLHHFWLVVDEYLPTTFLHCNLRRFQSSLPIQHSIFPLLHNFCSIVLPNREVKLTRITVMRAGRISTRML